MATNEIDGAKNPPMLEVCDISVSYGPIRAVTHASLEVRSGEMVALIGPNGAGKTTLLETVLGIHAPGAGAVQFRGSSIAGVSPYRNTRAGICLIPEGRGVFLSMNVRDNLLLGALHAGKEIAERLQRVYAWFPILKSRAKQIAATLSGGERHMLALGRALMASPALILLDEPSLGLAPIAVKDVFALLSRLNEEGYTILLAEQNANKALACAHRGYLLEAGRITLHGAAGELRKNPVVRAAYMGE